ncbi:uncharacterized protein B0H18DRAFT_1121009 [Fomitopsis serialis]|uniref:uncharacterized protein n=1 Tax=Fomitopsis serialis TaxID=139415 RepID=UPI00200801A8|nr:uncharacterized protein B0H18DRAFT_1121009 [Neoantrodia serialis]KAH9922184.1 hypothetical protein B0H18DRAFT_1121009 [Neoantrodia serialis]
MAAHAIILERFANATRASVNGSARPLSSVAGHCLMEPYYILDDPASVRANEFRNNWALSGNKMCPKIDSFEAHNYMKFSPYDVINDEGHHDFTLTFRHIQADLRDVACYYPRKTGFPR